MGTGKSRNLYSIKAISKIAETEYIMGKAKPLGNANFKISKIPIKGRAMPKAMQSLCVGYMTVTD